MIAGHVLYVSPEVIWFTRGRRLLCSLDGGHSCQPRAVLPIDQPRGVMAMHRLGRRLARAGCHHLVLTGADSALVVAHKHLYALQPDEKVLKRLCPLVGSRPLAFCDSDGVILYGEYRGNEQRSPVHVWAARPDGEDWTSVWRFNDVRHVHGVFADPYTDALWVTTGDDDYESALWKTADRFQTLERVVGGSQQLRAVQLLFTRDYIYFGSDAPDEPNYISRIHRDTRVLEQLQSVSGPIFFGCKAGQGVFFSTVVEPSEVNTSPYSEVWASFDGVNWRCIARYKKDIWSKKYFQYGQILFPAGPGDGRNLWYTPMATANDQKTVCRPLEKVWATVKKIL